MGKCLRSRQRGRGACIPTKSGEGERVTIKLAQTQNYAGSFRHGNAVPPPSRREAFAKSIITQNRQRKQVSCRNSFVGATIDRPYGKHSYEKPRNFALFIYIFISNYLTYLTISRTIFVISSICSSISLASLNCVRQRTRLCPAYFVAK